MGKLDVEHPELLEEWDYEKNGELSPKDVTAGSHKKVWWQCEKGHEWQATVGSRSAGNGCPFCSGRRAWPGFNDFATLNPELAAQWHPSKNGDLVPRDVTAGSHKKVWWRCDKGHEWQATVNDRSSGRGCPICSGRQVLAGFNDLATTQPDLAAQWHPTKNGGLTPHDVSAGSDKRIWWICEKGHEWQARIADRNKGTDCPFCSGNRPQAWFNDLATVNPDLAAQWHPTKNGDLSPKDVTTGSNKKVWWICEKGHEWQASVHSRSEGTNCPVCSGRKILEGFNDLATLRPDLALQWHPTKNGDLTPEQVTVSSNKKVWWECDKGHVWQAVVASRTYGNGCPVCSGEMKTSFPEQAILYYLSSFTPAKNRYRINKKYEVDIFLPEMNIAVEYDGWYWHRGTKKINIDERKNKYLAKLGIKLIRIIEIGKKERLPADKDSAIYCRPTQSASHLPVVINKLIRSIGLADNVDVDIKRDAIAIYDQYINEVKESSLLSLHPDLALQWHPTKNGDLTPDKVSSGSTKKVWWQCDKGHEWQASINSRTNKNAGCPICSGRQALQGFNDLATVNPDLAAQWHPTKNGDLSPKDVTTGSNKKVWWVCEKGHEYQASVYARNNGAGCSVCSGKKVLQGFNDLATVNPDLAAQWHPTKNGDLTPEMVTPASGKKVWWQCEKGHEWQASIHSRSKGTNCPVCSGRKILEGFNDLATLRPDLALQWHPTKNGELTPQDVTVSSNKKVWWQCEKGHEWQAIIENRSKGTGCPMCRKNLQTKD